MVISPSLDGILRHESIAYEGIRRPAEVLRALDGPAAADESGRHRPQSDHERQVLEQYFHDLYGVFMKKLSQFAVDPEPHQDEEVKIQALLQEMIKIKALIGRARDI